MKISVVTTCLNSERTVGYTLDSYFRQQHSEKELIVVDGGSTDRTLSIVRSFPQSDVILISEPDRGAYDAMNKGLRVFSGDAVGFLNSDDRFRDGQTQSEIADALEDADIAYGNLDFVADHASQKLVRRWQSSPFQKKSFIRGWMPPHPTLYARRKVIDAVGFFDDRYRIAADYDYMLRAMELHDFRSVHINRVLVDMMYGGSSTAGIKAYLISNLEAARSRQRWLDAEIFDMALIAKPLRKVTQFLAR
jgi:glycosyltransferase involved in cell wall biosynthesis